MKQLYNDIVGGMIVEQQEILEKYIENALIESTKHGLRYLVIYQKRIIERREELMSARMECDYMLTNAEYIGNSKDVIVIDTWSSNAKSRIDHILKARNIDKRESEAKCNT